MFDFREQVSIVLPFFRSAAYITEAVESVLAQRDFPDWRLYLVDDGSEEADVEIAADFSRRYGKRIELLQHPGNEHRGTSASRNLGIQQSGGEYVAFIDADDTWYPHKLANQVRLLEENREAVMVYGTALRWHSWKGEGDVHVTNRIEGYSTDRLVPGSALLQTFLHDEAQTPCTGSVLIRRRPLIECGGFEEQFQGLYDDQVLYAKLCFAGPVYVSSDCVSRYRKHPQSCCSQAAHNGTEAAARNRFLEWLGAYRERMLCVI